jgi:hypothetical protein
MTVSTYPDWEFRDPRLCNEDLSRLLRSATKAYSKLVSLALALRRSPHRRAAAPGDALAAMPISTGGNPGAQGMKPQRRMLISADRLSCPPAHFAIGRLLR